MTRPHSSFNSREYDEISKYFHLSIEEAARKFETCETNFKKKCRTLGINRWPNRKIQALQKLIAKIESELEKCNPEDYTHRHKISLLKEKLELLELNLNQILSDANHDLIPKHIRIAISRSIKETDLVIKQPSLSGLPSPSLGSASSPLRNNPFILWQPPSPRIHTLYAVKKLPDKCINNVFFYVENDYEKFVLFVKDSDCIEIFIKDINRFERALKKIKPIAKDTYGLDEKSISSLFTENGGFSLDHLSTPKAPSASL